jgi:leucyl-tRNA synthetase
MDDIRADDTRTDDTRTDDTRTDDFRAIEARWRPVWDAMPDLFTPRDDGSAPRRYLLDMFPYPSGDLHMGHGEAFPIGDAIARYWIQRGYDVLHPIGWDAFGLPAENAAIRRGADPAHWTAGNIGTQAESLRRYAISFDWSRRFHTCDPAFYRWNQWLFLRMYERGLAYRATAPVNWCPSCTTVLANEQVVNRACERCDTPVESRTLTQWLLRITAYADRLVDDLALLEDGWPAHVLTMQRNWIGRRDGGEGAGGPGYRLHDWLISRQRYWGTPIPIVHCGQCGPVAVSDGELPVVLPRRDAVDEWAAVPCPRCGRPARRETDTMDTFVDSSWYFLRYCSPSHEDGPFDPEAVRRWCPVDQYVGGVEHATGHLLYARFITKVLYDLGLVDFVEPFRRLLNQGQVIMDGAAMSKSRGNMASLGEQIDRYGVDAVRVTMLFAGPPADDIDWAHVNPAGAGRFLGRALRLAAGVAAGPARQAPDEALRRTTHREIARVTELVEAYRFNVAIARLMALVDAASTVDGADRATREAAEFVAVALSLFAPYTAEEMWARLGHPPGVARAGWPAPDEALAAEERVECVVQVDGRRRSTIWVSPTVDAAELESLALADPRVREAVGGAPVRRVVVKPPRVVNIVR